MGATGYDMQNINLADSFLAHNHSLGQDGAYNLDMYPSSQFTGAHAMVITGRCFRDSILLEVCQSSMLSFYRAI